MFNAVELVRAPPGREKEQEREEKMEGEHEQQPVGAEDLPAEVWAMVCAHLDTADLIRLSGTCWLLRVHALAKVKHHTVSPLGMPPPSRSSLSFFVLRPPPL
jgi:hypothetical protein